MLTVHQLAKSFALNSLFDNVTFSINPGDRAGLVGPNGCGKSTLLRIIAGQETADKGHVATESGLRLGYLAQGFELDGRAKLKEVVGAVAGDIDILEAELTGLAQELVEGGRTLADRLEDLQRGGTRPGGYFREIAGLFADAADALQHAHDSGVT